MSDCYNEVKILRRPMSHFRQRGETNGGYTDLQVAAKTEKKMTAC